MTEVQEEQLVKSLNAIAHSLRLIQETLAQATQRQQAEQKQGKSRSRS
jgi:hypothetical protein